MNYYAVLPNYRQMAHQTLHLNNAPTTSINPSVCASTPSVLLILGQALKSSIAQYSAFYTHQNAQTGMERSVAPAKEEKSMEKSSMELEQEEKLQKPSQFSKMEHGSNKENVVVIDGQTEKHSQNEAQSCTHDQIASENIICESNKLKNDVSMAPKKQKTRAKKQAFKVQVPSVDLIQTVDVSGLSIGRDELLRKKESLMLRQVEQWNEKVKNRRDKREIRMLND